jgi:septal ring factor EnvC (AmiA/AmiB activator)
MSNLNKNVAAEGKGMLGGELKISIRLAVLLQVVMMAAGAGATYTATRTAVDMDRVRIEEQSKAIGTLQVSMNQSQQELSGLTTAINYLTAEVKSMQERLWNTQSR